MYKLPSRCANVSRKSQFHKIVGEFRAQCAELPVAVPIPLILKENVEVMNRALHGHVPQVARLFVAPFVAAPDSER